MSELIGITSLNSAVGTLERLLRDHIASMETVNDNKQTDWKHGSLKRRPSKLHTVDAPKEITREDKVCMQQGGFVIVGPSFWNRLTHNLCHELSMPLFHKRLKTILFDSGQARSTSDEVTVSVRVIFMKIGVIDTIHDRYSAEIMLKSKWREPALDGKKQDADDLDWETYWNPRLSITNCVNDLKYNSNYQIIYDTNGKATVCETKRCSGTFFEFMELNKFPFDAQDLTVTVTSERLAKELEVVDDVFEPSGVNADAFSCEQEWRLEPAIHTWTKFTIKKSNKITFKYPTISVAAKAWRRPQFFIYNIIVIMFSICSLAFATFTVKLEAPESRLPLTFILVLTTVTFKFVVNKSLPRISYLTYLDKYILGSMIILCCVCVWHAVAGSVLHTLTMANNSTTTPVTTPAPSVVQILTSVAPTTPAVTNPSTSCSTVVAANKISSSPLARTIDYVAFGIFAAIYVGFHIVFLVLIACSTKSNDDEDSTNDTDGESSSVSGESNRSLQPTTDKIPFASAKSKADFNYGKLANPPQKCMTPIAE